jgi:hypothetical protein
MAGSSGLVKLANCLIKPGSSNRHAEFTVVSFEAAIVEFLIDGVVSPAR